MLEKELRSLNKTQLLALLRDQELEIQKIMKDEDALVAANKALKADIRSLDAENETLSIENELLEKENTVLKGQIGAMESRLAEAEKKAENTAVDAVAFIPPLETPQGIVDVMEAAQKSAASYLENIRALEEKTKAITEIQEQEARQKAEEIIRQAEHQYQEAENHHQEIINAMWLEFQERVNEYIGAYTNLRELLNKANIGVYPPVEIRGEGESNE